MAHIYHEEESQNVGTIASQRNLNAGPRASLVVGKYGVAAVLTGLDNKTSVMATNLEIEADGFKAADYGNPVGWAVSFCKPFVDNRSLWSYFK